MSAPKKPAAKQPTAAKPKPPAAKPTAAKPKPAAKKPAAAKPKPAAKKPAAKKKPGAKPKAATKKPAATKSGVRRRQLGGAKGDCSVCLAYGSQSERQACFEHLECETTNEHMKLYEAQRAALTKSKAYQQYIF